LSGVPGTSDRELAEETPLGFGFIVNAVEAYNPLQEDVQFGMRRRIFSDLEQRLEHIWWKYSGL
jgi:hypothetical protein